MAEWIDDADCYRCPDCGFETHNPNAYGCKCPVCGFVADSDKAEEKPTTKQPVTKVFKTDPNGLTIPIDTSILRPVQLQITLEEAQRELRTYRTAYRLLKKQLGVK